MANEEQLAVMRRALKANDISIWNKWKKENENTKIDLSGAVMRTVNLAMADLRMVNLSYSDLRGSSLGEADLKGSNFKWANLSGTDLSGIDLSGIDLSNSNLRGANFESANLTGANLRSANLKGADLSEANLSKTNLSHTDLEGTEFWNANLKETNLQGANLCEADLRNLNLRGSDLSEADLSEANLDRADLREVNLRGANLVRANLRGAFLDQANFENVKMNETILGLTDLSNCKNLDSVEISGPCIIDFATLQASTIPNNFLRKIGLPDNYIKYLPDFFDDNSIRLFPVFLSHNIEDKPFTRKLYEALINRNAQVWMDEKKIKPGDEIMGSISKAINVYDKMILVCSQQSLNSWWVDQELDRIMEKERQYQKASGTKERLLIPIRIDDSILNWQDSKAASIRKYHIGDFTNWQDPSAFDKALDDLVAALNVDRPDGGIISQLKKD